MSNISNYYAVAEQRPLDPDTVEVLRAVHTLLPQAHTPWFVVGATARDIMLSHVHGLPLGRATADVDFAIAVPDWQSFDQARQKLLDSAVFSGGARSQHRLHFTHHGGARTTPVDIVPFGGVASPAQAIAWPPDMAVIMNVIGYNEVLTAALEVLIAPELVVRIASLPGLALLKLFAWADRGHDNPKDALDLAVLINSYVDAGNIGRLYEPECEALMASVGYDLALAAPRLLGGDIRRLIQPPTLAALDALLSTRGYRTRLAYHMAPQLKSDENRVGRALNLIAQLHEGLAM